jgi:hypothetical protein
MTDFGYGPEDDDDDLDDSYTDYEAGFNGCVNIEKDSDEYNELVSDDDDD